MTRYDEWRTRAPDDDPWLKMEMQQEEEAREAMQQGKLEVLEPQFTLTDEELREFFEQFTKQDDKDEER